MVLSAWMPVTTVNVKGADASVDGNLQQMGRIGRIPSTNHKDEIQTQGIDIFHQFVNCVLSLLFVGGSVCVKKGKVLLS
jgi:hypothetical protein